ncbi:MAG TPA: hypothetical protein VMW17_04870, partial [Candidatus Binatia bacterium]|nr:hypothetical protein [Candidatus Binatia bacterium]
ICMMLFCLFFLVLGVRVLDLAGERLQRWLSRYLVLGLVISWGIQIDHLFIRFDHGRSYAVHPTNMECINHPLHLRELTDENDMHVVKP